MLSSCHPKRSNILEWISTLILMMIVMCKMDCRIQRIEHLDNLTKLDVLDLHGNQVRTFSGVLFLKCFQAIF